MFSQKRREAKEKYRYYGREMIKAREEAEIVNIMNEIFADVDDKVKMLAQII